MAKDPLLPEVPGEGDSWESLASNLLGIHLNKPLDSQSVSPEEFESLEFDVDEPPAEQPAPPAEPPAAFPEAVAAETKSAIEEPAVTEFEPESETSAAASSEPDRSDDPYWDPLAEWEWDVEPSSKRAAPSKPAKQEARPEQRELPAVAGSVEESIVKGPGADARRAADSFDTVSDYRDEYEGGDDLEFGAGLLEGVAPSEPQTRDQRPADAEARSRPAPRETQPERREPDRRRERADEPRRERAERASSRDEPRRPERREQRERREPAPTGPADDDDAFGAGLIDAGAASESADDEESREQRRPRRRGRRRGRSKGEPRSEELQADSADRGLEVEQEPTPPRVSTADLDDEEEETSDDASADSPYRNIPSWEEAISYLVNPKRAAAAEGESRSPSRESSRSESGGSHQGSGGRRRRRPAR